ncbi:MAG: radical SAM family heme chaperone HemW [Verrucomicrobiota bacterium]
MHVPFCKSKCGYCAFYSEVRKGDELRSCFLKALAEEASHDSNNCYPLTSIYIGGGTPTHLSENQLESLLLTIDTYFTREKDCEITCECNPESLTDRKIHILANHGVNRISLGVQSFKQRNRQVLQRCGNLKNLDNITAQIRKQGIDNLNFDLIFGIPGQTVDGWRGELLRAMDYGITHVSTYELTPEEGAKLKFSDRPPTVEEKEQEEEKLVEMWNETDRILTAGGFQRYEVSNHALDGRQCRHHQHCWHGLPFLGLGPSASSFDGRRRWRNAATLNGWRRGTPPVVDNLAEEQRALEVFAFGLRTTSGWERRILKERIGYDFQSLPCRKALSQLVDESLIQFTADKCIPTNKGLLFADYIVETILL